MNFSFTEDQLALRDSVATALRSACTPAVVRRAWEGPVPELRATLAELGLLAVNAPERCGGLGLGPLEWIQLSEVAGRTALPVPLLETFATNPALAEAGQDELLGRVATGEAFVTVVFGDGYALDADRADLVLRVDADGSLSAIQDPSLRAERSVDGARRLFAVEGERVPFAADGAAVFDRAALACAAELLGIGRKAVELAVEHVKQRHQFGKPIGSFQAVQHHLVDALSGLEFAAPLIWRAAHSLAHEDPERSMHVSLAKAQASDAADRAVKKALQVHGAMGYTTEYDLHLWLKRALALRSAWGDAAFHRERVATALLG